MLETKAGRGREGVTGGGLGGEGCIMKYNDMPTLNTIARPIICTLTFKINCQE